MAAHGCATSSSPPVGPPLPGKGTIIVEGGHIFEMVSFNLFHGGDVDSHSTHLVMGHSNPFITDILIAKGIGLAIEIVSR